jgi:hypothetical protein
MIRGHKGEIWKDIPDWPYHQASDHGRIRVLPGGIVGHRVVEKTELRIQTLTPDGYLVVIKHYRRYLSHWFILSAFTGQVKKPGYMAKHLNDIRFDNRPSNLEWRRRLNSDGTTRSSGMIKVRVGKSIREALGIMEKEVTIVRARQIVEQIANNRSFKAGLSNDKLIIQWSAE